MKENTKKMKILDNAIVKVKYLEKDLGKLKQTLEEEQKDEI